MTSSGPLTAGRRSGFVGRDAELALLSAARNRLARSQGSVVLLTGEPGIGKTRLLTAFIESTRRGRAKSIVTAECFERCAQAFGPIGELVRALLPDVRARLDTDDDTVLRRFVNEGDGTDVVAKQSQLFRALLALIERASQRSAIVFAIDDLQWADLTTLDFLRWLAPQLASLRIVIVCTCRADALADDSPVYDGIAGIVRHPAVHHVQVRGLEDEHIVSVAADQIAARTSRDVLDRIVRRSGGNPFFAEALAKQYDTSGEIATLPMSVRAAITARITLLPPPAREVLACASAAGYRFDLPFLTEVAGKQLADLEAAIRSCAQSGLIELDPLRSETYAFCHPLVQQAAYEMLSSSRAIHARVLSALERRRNDERYVEVLADHAFASGDADRIRRYSERAGETLLALGAVRDACTYFERAVDAAGDDPERGRIMERLGAAYQAAGNLTSSIATWRALLHQYIKCTQWDDAARVQGFLIGDTVNHVGSLDVSPADRFLGDYGSCLSADARNRLLALLAAVTSAVERFDDAQRYADAITDSTALPPLVRQNYLRAKMTIAVIRGRRADWFAAAGEALDVAAQIEAPFIAATAYGGVAATALYLEAPAQFNEALQSAQRLAEKHRLGGFAVYLKSVRAARCLLLGEIATAYAHATAVFQDEEVAVARQVLAACGVTIALESADAALAAQVIAPVLGQPHSEFHGSDGAKVLAQRAAFYLDRGDREMAVADLRHAASLANWSDPSAIMVFPLATQELPLEEAAALAHRQPSDTDGNIPVRANIALCAAMLAARSSNCDEKMRFGRESADLLHRLGWRLFETQALALASSSLAPSAQERPVLSPRERDVADAVAAGLSNAEIAARLCVSKKTVEKHIASIFDKLGLRSRTEIVAFVLSA